MITEHVPTAWAPFNKNNRFFRIGTTLSIDTDYRADATRFWNEEIPAILNPVGEANETHTSTASARTDEL